MPTYEARKNNRLPSAAQSLQPHLVMLRDPAPDDQEFAKARLITFLQEAKLDLPVVPEGYARYRGPLMGGDFRYVKKLYEFRQLLSKQNWYHACLALEYLVNLKADQERRSLIIIIFYLEDALCRG